MLKDKVDKQCVLNRSYVRGRRTVEEEKEEEEEGAEEEQVEVFD